MQSHETNYEDFKEADVWNAGGKFLLPGLWVKLHGIMNICNIHLLGPSPSLTMKKSSPRTAQP